MWPKIKARGDTIDFRLSKYDNLERKCCQYWVWFSNILKFLQTHFTSPIPIRICNNMTYFMQGCCKVWKSRGTNSNAARRRCPAVPSILSKSPPAPPPPACNMPVMELFMVYKKITFRSTNYITLLGLIWHPFWRRLLRLCDVKKIGLYIISNPNGWSCNLQLK